jgi:hypothetical protein
MHGINNNVKQLHVSAIRITMIGMYRQKPGSVDKQLQTAVIDLRLYIDLIHKADTKCALWRKIFFSKIHTKRINTLCGHIAELLNVKLGTNSNHCGLKSSSLHQLNQENAHRTQIRGWCNVEQAEDQTHTLPIAWATTTPRSTRPRVSYWAEARALPASTSLQSQPHRVFARPC